MTGYKHNAVVPWAKLRHLLTLLSLFVVLLLLTLALVFAPRIAQVTKPATGETVVEVPVETPVDYDKLSDVPVQCYGIPATSNIVCNGHGTCDWLNTCSCIKPYYGNKCDQKLAGTWCFAKQSTDAGVCSGHGTCAAENSCQCATGYTGDQCQYNKQDLYTRIKAQQLSYTGLSAFDSNLKYILDATTVGTAPGTIFTTAQQAAINAQLVTIGNLKSQLLSNGSELISNLALLGDISAEPTFTDRQKEDIAALHKVLERVLPMSVLGGEYAQLVVNGRANYAASLAGIAAGPGAGWTSARTTAISGWNAWRQFFTKYGQMRNIASPFDAALLYYNTGVSSDRLLAVLNNAGARLGSLFTKLMTNQTALYDVLTAKMRAYNLADTAKMSDLAKQMAMLRDTALPLIRFDPTTSRVALSDAWATEYAVQSPFDSTFVMEKRNLPADYISPEVLLHEACHNVQFRSCPVELIGTMACAIDSQDFIVSEGFATYCESLTENLGFMSRIHEAAKQAFPDYVRQSGSVVDVVKQSGFAGFRGAYKTSVHQINAVVAQLERAFFSGQITGDQFFDQVSALANSYYGYPSGYPSAAVVFIHWHIGLWAYLSGYDLGLYGWKQIANYAIANNTDIAAAVEQGDFRPLMDWMHNGPLANMHKYNIEQMVKVYTGKDYSPDDYVWSMEQFYAQMTGLQVAKSPAYVPATSTQQYSSSQDQAIAFAKYSAMVGKVAAATDNKHLTDYLAADTVGHLDMPIVPMPDASSLNITLIESS